MRQLQPLRPYLNAQLGHARQVATWSAQAGNETELHGIARAGEDNGYSRGRRLRRQISRGISEDHSHLTTNQLSRHRRRSVILPLQPPVLDPHVLALDVAGFLQSLSKCRHVRRERPGRSAVEKADHRHCRLLRPRRERPSCCSAEQPDEVAASHSITSSARASTVAGTSRPSALAVFRLITSSYLVGACTGRSAGFSPLRMRST